MENNENNENIINNPVEVKSEVVEPVVENKIEPKIEEKAEAKVETKVKTDAFTNTDGKGINPFAIASVFFAIIGIFAYGFAFGLAAVVAGIKGLMVKDKNPVFKIVALIGLVAGGTEVIVVSYNLITSYNAALNNPYIW